MNKARRRAMEMLTRLVGLGSATSAASLLASAGTATQAGDGSAKRHDRTIMQLSDFGVRGDGKVDDGDAIRRAFARIAQIHNDTGGATPRVHVTPGIYAYEQSPNFAVTNLVLDCAPGVIFRHLGQGPAFLLDGGEKGDGVYRTRILGSPTVQGNARTGIGIDVQALHHSTVTASVRDVATAVLRTRWSVATEFQIRSTGLGINGSNPVPLDGLILDGRAAGEDTVACLFQLPIIEQVRNIGIRLVRANNCTFISGTSEANGVGGLHIAAASTCNTFMGLDLEFNGKFGIQCEGERNGFVGVNDDKFSAFGGRNNWVKGHQFNTIVNTGDGNAFDSVSYSANGGTFTDNGTSTRRSLVRNLTSGLLDPDRAGRAAGAVPLPAGGSVRDAEARAALADLIAKLSAAGIIG